MNTAMQMLRDRAQKLYDMIAGESEVELLIDPIEEVPSAVPVQPRLESTMIGPVLNLELSRSMTDSLNLPFDPCLAHVNWLFEQRGKVKVWIYNVSQQEHTLRNGFIRELRIPACSEGAEYAVATSLPAVVIYPKANIDSGEIDYTIIDGRRVAMDLINSSNLGIDQDKGDDFSKLGLAIGNDFSKKGVFFSTHNPPLKRELKAAIKRLKKYYTDLVDCANIVRITSASVTLGVPTSELSAAVKFIEGPHSIK